MQLKDSALPSRAAVPAAALYQEVAQEAVQEAARAEVRAAVPAAAHPEEAAPEAAHAEVRPAGRFRLLDWALEEHQVSKIDETNNASS